MSYPGNPLMPPIEELETIAAEYVRSVSAGAGIVHHHGIHYLEHEMQADGRRLSRIDHDGWKRLTELIRSECSPSVQFAIARARPTRREAHADGARARDDALPAQPPQRVLPARPVTPGKRAARASPAGRAGDLLPGGAGARREDRGAVLLHGRLLEPPVHPS